MKQFCFYGQKLPPWGGVVVGIPVVSLGVAIGALVGAGAAIGTSEPFGRGLDVVALGGPPVFTSELIGEDSLAGH